MSYTNANQGSRGKKRYDSGFLVLAIIFFLLCSVSPSTVCLQRASLLRMLSVFFFVFGECQAPPIGLEFELQRFGPFQWIRVDANILKTMTRKTEKTNMVFARVDGPSEDIQASPHILWPGVVSLLFTCKLEPFAPPELHLRHDSFPSVCGTDERNVCRL